MSNSAPYFVARRSAFSGRKLRFELLEDRKMLAVFTVTNLNDAALGGPDSAGTLRQAIADANSSPDADVIQFAANLSGAVHLAIIGDIDVSVGASGLLISSPITIRGNSNGITIDRAPTATDQRLVRLTPAGNLTLDSITLAGGTARGQSVGSGQTAGNGLGGAIYNQGTLALIGSTLSGNSAVGGNAGTGGTGGAGLGGAIYNDGGSISIENSTVSGNFASSGSGTSTATSFAGALYSKNGSLSIYNSTIVNNAATSAFQIFIIGVGVAQTATAHIDSSIIAQLGTSTNGFDLLATNDNGGHIDVSGANNLIRKQNDYQTIAVSSADPMLGPLADHDGPTFTHAPMANSPVIDHGANPLQLANDQRGGLYARVAGGIADIGAVEFQTVAGPALQGDYNRNNLVDAADFVVWQMTQGTHVPKYSGADGNGDSFVDAIDYNLWRNHFGSSLPGGAAVSVATVDATNIESRQPAASQAEATVKTPSISSRFSPSTSVSHLKPHALIRDSHLNSAVNQKVHDQALLTVVAELPNALHAIAACTLPEDGSETRNPSSKSGGIHIAMEIALNQPPLRTGSLAAASICTA